MDNKKVWNLMGGIALVAVAAFVFITGIDPTYRYLGGGLLALLGVVVLYIGLKRPTKEA
jgi:hypothetical protein